jgi:thioredoxin reductase
VRTVVVEREAIGGQAGTSSLIRNYLGFSRGLSGAELCSAAISRRGSSALDSLSLAKWSD